MDSELRPTMLLSSLVQTRSMELVLAPIASQVSEKYYSKRKEKILCNLLLWDSRIWKHTNWLQSPSGLSADDLDGDTRKYSFP